MSKAPEGALKSLSLSFYGKGTRAQWDRYGTEGGFDLDNDDGDVDFCALPEQVKTGVLYLYGGFHHCGGSRQDEVHWHLNLAPCVDDEPPADMVEASARAGGIQNALEKLQEFWPGDATVDVGVTAQFDGANLGIRPPKPISFEETENIGAWGSKYSLSPTLVGQSWKVEPPLGVISSLLFIYNVGGLTLVTASGSLTTPVSATMIDLAQEQLWRSLSVFRET